MNRYSECVLGGGEESEKGRVGNYFKELIYKQEQEMEHLGEEREQPS